MTNGKTMVVCVLLVLTVSSCAERDPVRADSIRRYEVLLHSEQASSSLRSGHTFLECSAAPRNAPNVESERIAWSTYEGSPVLDEIVGYGGVQRVTTKDAVYFVFPPTTLAQPVDSEPELSPREAILRAGQLTPLTVSEMRHLDTAALRRFVAAAELRSANAWATRGSIVVQTTRCVGIAWRGNDSEPNIGVVDILPIAGDWVVSIRVQAKSAPLDLLMVDLICSVTAAE